MAEYKSKKQTKAENKRNPGTYKTVDLKSSDFLPNVFKSRLNQKWLDSTFDTLISKGALEDVDAYVGDSSGRHTQKEDQLSYLNTGNTNIQLAPGISSTNRITYDDVAQGLEQYFDEYNYNSAYSTQSYSYNPPINKDKFLNFSSYYWVEDLPVYQSDNTNGTTTYNTNVIADINGKPTHTFVDDDNSFELHDGMRIKLINGYGTDYNNHIYLVTGVGYKIRLIEYTDIRNAVGYPLWTDETRYSNSTKGYWDSIDVVTWTYKRGSATDSRGTDPQQLITDYNTDLANVGTNTAPAMWYYANGDEKAYFADGQVIKFDTSWPTVNPVDVHKIYWVTVTASGVSLTPIVDATQSAGAITQTIPGTLTAAQETVAKSYLSQSWDSNVNWDTLYMPTALKDYFVIDRGCPSATAWSRSNMWIHRDTLFALADLDTMKMDASQFATTDNQAKRPIIEFEGGMEMLYHGNQYSTNTWAGPVDFILEEDSLKTKVQHQQTYYVLDTNEIKIRQSGIADTVKTTLAVGDTFLVRQALSDTDAKTAALTTKYVRHDLWVDTGNYTKIGQTKQNVNQPPLFTLYDSDDVRLDDATKYPDSTFLGNKILAYKVGTGTTIDTELDMVLSFKDIGPKANYEFVNHLHNDTYTFSLLTNDSGLVDTDTIPGYYSYKQKGNTRHVYTPSTIQRGAKEKIKHTVTDSTVAQTVPVGHASWRSDRAFYVYRYGATGTFTVTESYGSGIYNDKKSIQPTLVVRAGATYVFEDLVGSFAFYDNDGGSAYTTGVTSSGNTHTIVMPANERSIWYGYSASNKGKIIVLDTDDYLYHDLYIDGKRIQQSKYTINANDISVPASLVNANSVIDVEFRDIDATNKTSVYSIPDVHEHNARNQVLKEFTIAETFEHWNDIIYKTPGLTGQSFGINDYHKSVKLTNTGGTIFMYDDISIMHDYTFANRNFDVREALSKQAREFTGFRKRFIAQVLRLYRQNTYGSVKDIVRDALKAITATRKGTELHANSNMVYFADGRQYKANLATNQTAITFQVPINTSFNGMDHAYLYLSENNGAGAYYERLLIKDIDYTISGSNITLASSTTAVSANDPAFLTIQFIDEEEKSYVPASAVKLGLASAVPPTIQNDEIILHDGSRHKWTGVTDLYDVTQPDFDVVTATLWDLEKRIWAGLVDLENTVSPNVYLPAPHNSTWYDKNKVDNYIEQLWADYYSREKLEFYNPENYYDSTDDTTWNYNSLTHNGKTVPGYWRGAYIYIFGTDTPDITPWHMLGHNKKPTWWDTHYSWTDATKRTALINSLTNGIVSNPLDANQTTDIRYARHNWDWTNKSPVTNAGALEERSTVLGTPAAIAAAKDFDFGDWGPYEIEWRMSSEGQSALVDAMLKLNPARGWTDFFQPGLFVRNGDSDTDKIVQKYNKTIIDPTNFLFDGEVFGEKVKQLKLKSSTTGWGTTSTLDLYSSDTIRKGQVKLNIDSTGTIQSISMLEGSIGYSGTPVYDVQNLGSGKDNDALMSFEFIMAPAIFTANGINAVITNNLQRNYITSTVEKEYKALTTKLMQKVGGFTSESLLKFYTESGAKGRYKVSNNDYAVHLYDTATPRSLVNISQVNLKKKLSGYAVSGYSAGKQKFYFYEPLRKGNNFDNITLPNSATVKKYNEYDYSSVSSIEFNGEFAKVQDLYDFVRGYHEYLRVKGVVANNYAGAAHATDAVVWATGATLHDTEELLIGAKVTYTGTNGRLISFGTLPGGMNSILNENGKPYNDKEIKVDRLKKEAIVTLVGPANEFGSITFAEIDFEHIVEFANTTQFNDTLFNDVTNQRHHRLILQGQRTKNWDGNTRTPGYIVFDNKIVENFDTSVRAIDELYNYDARKLNTQYKKAQDLTIGNYDKKWVNDTLINDQTFSKFYQGMLKSKGTTGSITPFNRSSMLNDGASIASIQEEWMFRHSYYGDTTNVNATEIALKPSQVDNNVEVINFSDADIEFVNGTSVAFNTESMSSFNNRAYLVKTAGEVLNETENSKGNIVKNLPAMKTIYDSTADYANTETWIGTKSYKRGDLVRRNGYLYKCNVNAIGYTTEGSGLVFTGSTPSPTFTYASQAASDAASAVIDGTSVWFDEQSTVFNNIVVTGSVTNPSVNSGESIIIDGTTVTLTNVNLVEVIDTTATEDGNAFVTCNLSSTSDPIISNNTGEALIINGATISLIDGSFPAGSSLTKANVVAFINGTADTRLSAKLSSGNIIIEYEANGDVNADLVIGTGSANNDLNLTSGTYTPTTKLVSQAQNMDAATLATKINASAQTPADITAVEVSNQLQIIKAPTTATTANTVLALGGNVSTVAGLASSTQVTSSLQNNVPQTVFDARDSINNAGITNVTASVNSNNQLVITSTSSVSVDLGLSTNDMNTQAGLAQSGIQYAQNTSVANTFDVSMWTDVSDDDEALFNIQVINDANSHNADQSVAGPTLNVTGLGSVSTQVPSVFNGWNVFQIQNLGWYSQVDDGTGTLTDICSICAGTASIDGNDAQVNLTDGTPGFQHNLEIGDYVMIVNSTTTPNCDGIHKVTKLGDASAAGQRAFYIDMFIEECGSAPQIYVLRNARFNDYDDIRKANANTNYKWKSGDYAWSTQHTDSSSAGRGTYVYKHDGTDFIIDTTRTVLDRAINNSRDETLNALAFARIYDGSKNGRQTSLELEVFDPMLRKIPGIADMQINVRSFVDRASYTHSTDLNEQTLLNVPNAWGKEEVGQVWWDLSTAIYYDYNQGSAEYKKEYWGKLWEGSSIDVYEWTKSTILPEEWDSSVTSGVEVDGVAITGTPYKIVDTASGEETYYYTTDQDYNERTGSYDTVYYFWVKDKTTFAQSGNRSLNVKQLASIIKDPTANGISWCAGISATELIVANVQFGVTNTSVLQINKVLGKAAHDSWTVLQEGTGLIPEYWYKGMLDNLVGRQATSGKAFPNTDLHEYNRFGDDRALGQGWFYDTMSARQEAIAHINKRLRNINLVQDLENKWDRTIGGDKHFVDIDLDYTNLASWQPSTVYAGGDLVKFNNVIYRAKSAHTSGTSSYAAFGNNTTWRRYASIYDMTSMWDYTDYIIPTRLTNEQPTFIITNKNELSGIDTTKHRIVELRIIDLDGFDRTEILKWDGTEWVIQEKKNATIEFKDWLWKQGKTPWDSVGWDVTNWDSTLQVWWHYIVYTLRNDILIERHVDEFNKFFFALVRHCLAEQKQVDWVYKTTYIQVDVTTTTNTTTNKYKRGTINTLLGYINDVKPFHTKIRNVIDNNTVNEQATVGIVETMRSISTIKLNQFQTQTAEDRISADAYVNNGNTTLQSKRDVIDGTFVPDISVTTHKTMLPNVYGNDTFATDFSGTANTIEYDGEVFTTSTIPSTQIEGGGFINTEDYNHTTDTTVPNNRNSLAKWDFSENLTVTVITNTSGSTYNTDSRTFLYRLDGKLNNFIDVLETAKSTTTTANVTNTDTTIPVTDSTQFNGDEGYAYINGEVIKYAYAHSNNLYEVTRGYASQKAHASGSTIVNITDANVYTETLKGTTNASNEYVDSNKLNDITMSGGNVTGVTSVLTGTGRLSARMQSGTQGIDL